MSDRRFRPINSGLFKNNLTLEDGKYIRIYDSNNSGYLQIAHDGTDAQITTFGTGDIDIDQSIALRGGAAGLKLYGTTDDHLYVSFYADAAAQTTRSGYMGFSSAGSEIFQFVLDGYSSGSFSFNKNTHFSSAISVADGITAPSTVSGKAFIYVDTSDGDLKVKFGDGTVKTIATDT